MLYASFRPFRRRHPLARLLTAVLGVLAVLVVIALGVFAVAALAIGGGVYVLVNALRSPRTATARPRARPAATPEGVIEGEFTVVPAAARARDAMH